ncbi:MAG TPA: hypothetical protein ENH94_07715 [Phycisphaerales bacterium]|nr:hypothetical protein [Phycisphaerales bacterium]
MSVGWKRAPAVRRTYIDKNGGKQQRPLGIPTVEDKVLQRGVAMILEAVYEQDFYDCSYGFSPKRSPHQALKSLRGVSGLKTRANDTKQLFVSLLKHDTFVLTKYFRFSSTLWSRPWCVPPPHVLL